MDGLSVIIPSRNEKYLEPTIKNVLKNARGEVEILVILDGWLPDPPIDLKDDRVRFFHFKESIGQRQSINYAAKEAKGKYVMKLDAHCAVGVGFDVILAKDCEYDWTVIPRMYNLDIETFLPKKHKRTDYMYMTVREDGQFRALYYTGEDYRRLHNLTKPIDETMCCMGPCFYMHKDRFWELGGCDENHGGWGSQGIEVSCKAWLSGGKLIVNKNTWFAHWFRGGGGPGFPYKLSGNQVKHAREYAKDLWIGDKWPLAKRKFEWLVAKFNPPGWKKEPIVKPEVYKPRSAKSHVHGRSMSVDNLVQNIEEYWVPRKKYRTKGFQDVIQFFRDLNSGATFETNEDLQAHPYYDYVRTGFTSVHPATFLKIMQDSIALFHDIKAHGFKNPIEVWVEKGKYNISRGTRRLAIAYVLGVKDIAVKIYESEEFAKKLRPNPHVEPSSINAVAQAQFQRWGHKATDKYWIHNYLVHYDAHIGNLMQTATKVLEIGVQRGPSTRLWQEAFPKAQIYGVDIDMSQARLARDVERITLLEGSQIDPKFIKEKVAPKGPFDVIIDDASHIPEHQKVGFDFLWSSVVPGGWYVVEDLFYRNYFRNKGTDNMMAKLSRLVDDMNMKCEIESMHFYYNICFIKRRNVGQYE